MSQPTWLTLGVGLDEIPSEVRHCRIDSSRLLLPESNDTRVERVKSAQVAKKHRRREIHRGANLNTVWSHSVRDPLHASNVCRVENVGISVDIINDNGIETDGGHNAGVVSNTVEVLPDCAIRPKD